MNDFNLKKINIKILSLVILLLILPNFTALGYAIDNNNSFTAKDSNFTPTLFEKESIQSDDEKIKEERSTTKDHFLTEIKEDKQNLDRDDEKIELEISLSEIIVEDIYAPTGDIYQRLSIDEGGNLGQIGYPRLPFRTLKILLPFGKDMEDIRILVGKEHALKGTYKIEPAQLPIPIGSGDIPEFTLDCSVYDSTDPLPEKLYSIEGVYELRGYKILVLNLYPVRYIPKTGIISYFGDMKVLVSLKDCVEGNQLFRGLKVDEERVKRTVDNPQLIETYIKNTNSVNTLDSPLDLPPGQYDYVIITNEALNNSDGTYTFQDLVDYKNSMGIQTTIITVEDIYEDYTGADNQTKIRNFIIDAYTNWEIEYVLLGGDGDGDDLGGESEVAIIPSRGFYDDCGGIEVDDNIPSDLYYAGLDGTWNDDDDEYWGEPGEDDLYAEVYIGRAPIDSEEELSNFVMKTLEHENSNDPYLLEALMVGEYLGWIPWGGDYKDEIKDGSDSWGYSTVGFPEIFNVETLYDRDTSLYWDKYDLMALINDGKHIINHLGHADVNYVMKMDNQDADSLINENYFFGYSQGCYDGSFDNRDSYGTYHDYDSIAEHFVSTPHGAFAFIGNSRYGWGNRYTTDGPSQHYDREFFDAIFGEDIEEIGKANQDSKEDNIGFISEPCMRWCYYQTNLFGDPTATFPIVEYDHDLSVSLEVPTSPEIESTYTINATVTNNGNNDETDVDLILYLDDVPVASTTITTLHIDMSVTIDYEWTPTEIGTYNFTAYAPPVPDETCISNNIDTELVYISGLKNYLMHVDNPYVWIDASGGTELYLSDDGYIDLSLPFSFPFYNDTFSTIYLGANGYLSFTDSSPNDYSNDPIPSADPDNYYLIAPFWDDLQSFTGGGGGTIYVQSFGTYWVAEWEHIEHYYGDLVGTFELVLHENGDIVFNYDYIDYVGGGYTCGLNLGLNTMYYNTYQELASSTDDFSILFAQPIPPDAPSNPTPPNDATDERPPLGVLVTDPNGDYMDVYFYNASDDSLIWTAFGIQSGNIAVAPWFGLSNYTTYFWYAVADDGINQTSSEVWNFTTGLNHRPIAPSSPSPLNGATGVSHNPTLSVEVSDPDGDYMDVYFYDASDDSLIDAVFDVQDGETAEVIWYGLSFETTYSWYAIAYDGMNIAISSTWSFTTKEPPLFNGMYLNYTSSLFEGCSCDFLYTDLSGDILNVNWILDGGTVGWWNVNMQTRIMSDGGGLYFGNGYHTPIWIFTDVLIGDTVLIAVDGVGDHDFYVSDEMVWELPGFGAVEVWVLEDLTEPGGLAYYEKNTGILLDGIFYYGDGDYFYEFELVGTNAIIVPDAPSNPSPSDGAIILSTNPILSVNVSDPDDLSMDVYFLQRF